MIHHPPPGPRPIRAHPGPNLVTIVVDPATARSIADAWEFTHASGGLDYARPRYLADVAHIRRAAAAADPEPTRAALVEFLQTPGEVAAAGEGAATTPGPRLQLVRDDNPA